MASFQFLLTMFTPLISNATTLNIKDPCNENCSCLLSTYKPLCGPGGINYFSPCLAGCTTVANKSYTRCSCLSSPKTVLKPGLCDRDCKNLAYFLIGAVILTIFSFSNVIPSKIVTLRSVPDNQRGYALGLQFVFLRSLGSLPGPIVFGHLIDTTCTVWQTKCGRDGNCLNYDHVKLSWILMGAAMPTYGRSGSNKHCPVLRTTYLGITARSKCSCKTIMLTVKTARIMNCNWSNKLRNKRIAVV